MAKELSKTYSADEVESKWYQAWEEKMTAARERAETLSRRFEKWYYVISSESFDKIDLTRGDLTKRKET